MATRNDFLKQISASGGSTTNTKAAFLEKIKEGSSANADTVKHGGTGGKIEPPKSDGGKTTKTKNDKGYVPEINTLGAGNYGGDKKTRIDNILYAGVKGSAAGLVNAHGLMMSPDGNLTMGESIRAAREGKSQQEVEAEKRKSQAETQQKIFEKADSLAAKASEHEAEAKEGLGKVGRFAVDLGIGATQLAGDMAANVVAPGMGLASMGARSFGSGAQEARLRGLDTDKQLVAGFKSAAIEILTEKLGGGAFKKIYGKGVLDDVLDNTIRKIKLPSGAKNVATWLKDASVEGVEEVISAIANPIADRALDLDKDAKIDLKDALYQGLLGTALGGIGATGNVISNRVAAKTQKSDTGAGNVVVDTLAGVNRGKANENAASNAATVQNERVKQISAMLVNEGVAPEQAQEKAEVINALVLGEDVSGKRIDRVLGGTNDTATLKVFTDVTGIEIPSGTTSAQLRKIYRSTAETMAARTETETAPNYIWEGIKAHRAMQEQQTVGRTQAREEATDIINAMLGRPMGQANAAIKIDDMSSDTPKQDAATVVAKLYSAIPELSNTPVLRYLTGNEFAPQKGKKLSEQVTDFFNSLGNIVRRVGFGDVRLDKWSVKSDIAHGLGRAKAVTFAAVEDVIRDGVQIDYQPNWKGRGRDSYVFAGAVNVAGKRSYVAAVVLRGEDSRFYLHEVVDEAGNIIIMNRNSTPEAIKTGVSANRLNTGSSEVLFNNSIPDNPENVNTLPEGMGAASAYNEADMSVGERWQAQEQGKDNPQMHSISAEQAANLAAQRGRAAEEIPKYDLEGRLTSKLISTIVNSGVTPDAIVGKIMDDAAQGKYSRMAYSDSDAIAKAEKIIEADGYQTALSNYKASVNKGIVNKDMTVMGIVLYNNAVNSGDYLTAHDLIDCMKRNGEAGAQATQANRILNKLSPEGRLYSAAKEIDRLQSELREKYKDKAPELTVDETIFAEYAEALKSGDDAEIERTLGALEQNIADQIPANWLDKLNAWRYLAMLGNPRTHIRNIAGNVGFTPLWMMKDALAAGIETVFIKDGKRTKAVINPFEAADRALMQTAWSDYANVVDAIMSTGKFDDSYSRIEDKRTIFTKLKNVEAARKLNSKALNAEDGWIAQPRYAVALAGYLKANNISAADYANGNISEETASDAQAYAIEEAKKATYRDCNAFSNWAASLGKSRLKPVNWATEGIFPFKRTPANIAVRAVEYSPISLAGAIFWNRAKLKRGEITAAEYIDKLSAGLTGSALVGLGLLLAIEDVLNGGGSGDDEQDKFDKLRGTQNYSISLGDSTVTIDWLAPASMPLFVGVEIYNNRFKGKGLTVENIFGAIANITNPMIEMSMLQGVNDMIDSLSYATDGNGGYKLIAQIAANLLSQFIPTTGGQIERTLGSEVRETTFINKNSQLSGDLQYTIGNILNKVPFADYQQIPYIDAWGRTESTGNIAQRAANNFINPAYVKEKSNTEIDDELQRLYDAGFTAVFPDRASSGDKVDDEYMNAEQFVTYATTKGQTALEVATGVISSAGYANLSDADKAKAISEAYSYAKAKAKQSVKRDVSVESWIGRADSSGDVAEYIVAKTYAGRYTDDSSTNSAKLRGLISGGYTGSQLIEAARQQIDSDNLCAALEVVSRAGVSPNVFVDVYEYKSNTSSTKDANGKTIESLQDKMIKYINSLEVSRAEKRAIFSAFYPKGKNPF